MARDPSGPEGSVHYFFLHGQQEIHIKTLYGEVVHNRFVVIPPPPCISYAKVPNQYGPYAYCSLGQVLALRAHCVHTTDAEAGILTQEYLSPV